MLRFPHALSRSAYFLTPSRAFPPLPKLRILLLTAVVGLCPSTLVAQEPTADDVIRVRTDLVTVPAMVTDAKGRRVAGLKQGDFLIRDEGKIVPLDHFSSGSDRVALIFLLDASGSSRDYLAKQREAALALFARFGPGSQIAVLPFGETAKVAVPFTSDIEKARSGFDFPAVVGRHTAIFDSIGTAIGLFAERKHDPTERHIIILSSDGLDTASTTKATSIIASARANDISLYVIQFPLFVPRDGRLALRDTAKGFRDLALQTGGKHFLAGDVKMALQPGARYDLGPVFAAIEEDLASQYVLGFYPARDATDARPHRLEVELKQRAHGHRVRTLRESYNLKH
jgi:Ca-activated chloride channel family protein